MSGGHVSLCIKKDLTSAVAFSGQNEDTQTREVGWNKYVKITGQIYRIEVLYNS